MKKRRRRMPRLKGFSGGGIMRSLVIVGVSVVMASGCAHVNRDELHAELDQVRTEMREGDQAVEDRLTAEIRGLEDRMEVRMASLENGLRELQGEFDVVVARFDSAIRFNAPVHFAFDDATVRETDRAVLDRFAEVVREYYGEALITVEGFTDPAGSVEYNQRLGEARARAVLDYLSGRGIPSSRMRAVSYGADPDRQVVPGAQGPGGDGWQNRRVAMVIDFSGNTGSPPLAQQSEGLTVLD